MRILGVDINTRHTGWLGAGIFLRALAGFAGSVLFIRAADAELYGKYQYILSLSALGAMLMLPGYTCGLINSSTNGTHGDFAAAVKHKLKLYPFYVLFFAIISAAMFYLGKGWDISAGFLIAGIFGGLIAVLNGYMSYYTGAKDYKTLSRWNFVISASSIIPGLLYLLFETVGCKMPASILVLTALLWQLSAYIIMRAKVRRKLKNSAVNAELKKYSVNLSAMSIIGGAQSYLDQFIVGSFVNYSALGYYTLARNFFNVLTNVCIDMQKYIQPRFSGKLWQDAAAYFKKYLRLYYILIPAFTVIYFALPFFYETIYGADCLISANYARLFLIILSANIPNFYVESYLRAKQSYRDMWISRIIGASMLAVLVPMTIYFSVWGVITTRLFTSIIVSSVMIYIFYTIPKRRTDEKEPSAYRRNCEN